MAKSADAFRTISEVAEILQVPAHVLRFWESRFTQVKPVKRAGGRRYYRPGDIQLLSGIRKLLHDDGMTIKGVQKILRAHGVAHVAAMAPALTEMQSGMPETDAPETPGAKVLSFAPRAGADADPAPTDIAPDDAPAELPPGPDPEPQPAAHTPPPPPPVDAPEHDAEPTAEPPETAPPDTAPAPVTSEDTTAPAPEALEASKPAAPSDTAPAPVTPADTTAPAPEAPEASEPAAPPLPPLPDLPDDPDDTDPAPAGALAALAGLRGPVPADLATRLAAIAAQLHGLDTQRPTTVAPNTAPNMASNTATGD